ncbi:MAG TPA: prepilin-type N-terminal cleavage/methylation domain-containing protein [Verrucomicrobiota bacterium]|nr:prepilin-type N-terminal cleavage/methylation domain-containing protein [Verrucomicrobiota bacterium]
MMLSAIFQHASRRRLRRQAGMTLPEIMVTSAVFSIALGGFIAVNLFALRMNELTKVKLGASDDARVAIGKMVSEIRMAGVVRIGDGNETYFQESAPGQAQMGNAVQIYPTKANTNVFIRYFLDDLDSKLKRTLNGSSTTVIIANSITNQVVFRSEDYSGQVLSNNFNNRVISVTLQFYQLDFPAIAIGPGQQYDFYQLRTKITRRALE